MHIVDELSVVTGCFFNGTGHYISEGAELRLVTELILVAELSVVRELSVVTELSLVTEWSLVDGG